MFSLVILPIYKGLTPEDQKYFRQSREAGLGQTLEEVSPTVSLSSFQTRPYALTATHVEARFTTAPYVAACLHCQE